MANSSGSVRVKKVSAYPIAVSIDGQSGQIVKLSPTGFLVQTTKPLKVNLVITSQFTLPVMKKVISFSGMIIKTYDQFRGGLGQDGKNVKIAELVFQSLGTGQKEQITYFLQKIGQVR